MIAYPVVVPSHVAAALAVGEHAELDIDTGAWFGVAGPQRRPLGLAERRFDVLRPDGSVAQSVEFRPEINARCVVVMSEAITVEVGADEPVDVAPGEPSLFTRFAVSGRIPPPVLEVMIPSEVKA